MWTVKANLKQNWAVDVGILLIGKGLGTSEITANLRDTCPQFLGELEAERKNNCRQENSASCLFENAKHES